MNPFVSIIIPCFNSEKYIIETLQSVNIQTNRDFECIIIDDGSTDDSAIIINQFISDKTNFKYYLKPNGGLSSARNFGIHNSTGNFLLFLDSDDLIDKSYVDKTKNKSMNIKGDVILTGFELLSSNLGEVLSSSHPLHSDNYLNNLMFANIGPCHSFLVNSEILQKTGLFSEELKSCEDWDLWIRIAKVNAKFITLDDKLVYYRMSENSMSRNADNFLAAGISVLENSRQFDNRLSDKALNQSVFTKEAYPIDKSVKNWLMLCCGLYIQNKQPSKAIAHSHEICKRFNLTLDYKDFTMLFSYLTFPKTPNSEDIQATILDNFNSYVAYISGISDLSEKKDFVFHALNHLINFLNNKYLHESQIDNLTITKRDLAKLVTKKFKRKFSFLTF